MSTKYKLRITGECKQNMKLCKRRGLPMDELWTVPLTAIGVTTATLDLGGTIGKIALG
jgi:hypothetical protein